MKVVCFLVAWQAKRSTNLVIRCHLLQHSSTHLAHSPHSLTSFTSKHSSTFTFLSFHLLEFFSYFLHSFLSTFLHFSICSSFYISWGWFKHRPTIIGQLWAKKERAKWTKLHAAVDYLVSLYASINFVLIIYWSYEQSFFFTVLYFVHFYPVYPLALELIWVMNFWSFYLGLWKSFYRKKKSLMGIHVVNWPWQPWICSCRIYQMKMVYGKPWVAELIDEEGGNRNIQICFKGLHQVGNGDK